MNDLNNAFLEEFKALDKLCREVFRSEKGVTTYIDFMRSIPVYESQHIPNWSSDLRQLVRLRHLRNQLTHELGTLNMNLCTQNDILWLRNFYNRIFARTDPAAILYQKRTMPQTANASVQKQRPQVHRAPEMHEDSPDRLTALILSVLAFVLCICITVGILLWMLNTV